MAEICLDCLQKQKPWITDDMAILYSQPDKCDECGQNKKLVYVYTDSDEKLLIKQSCLPIQYNLGWFIHFTSLSTVEPRLNEVEITLRDLVVNLGWDVVRNRYMYIKGQEEGKPLAFKTHEEYEPYLNYRVVKLENEIIIEPKVTAE